MNVDVDEVRMLDKSDKSCGACLPCGADHYAVHSGSLS